jgi:hypothetical protein
LIVSVNVDFDQVAVVTCSVSVGATVSGVPGEVPAGASGPRHEAARFVTAVLETPLPCTLKLTADCPAATVTVGGNFAGLESLADNDTVSPPCGAGWFSVTVPVVDTPLPTIVYGLRLYLVIVIGRLPVNSTPLRFVVVTVTDCGAKPKVPPWAVVV